MQARTDTFESELDLRTQLRDKSKEGDRSIILGADDGADDGANIGEELIDRKGTQESEHKSTEGGYQVSCTVEIDDI